MSNTYITKRKTKALKRATTPGGTGNRPFWKFKDKRTHRKEPIPMTEKDFQSHPMTAPDDTVQIMQPMLLNKSIITGKLRSLINMLGECTEGNEMDYSIETDKLIDEMKLYDKAWKEQNVIKEGHSREGTELADEFAKILMDIPDGGAECFPFETILRISREYGLGITEEDIY